MGLSYPKQFLKMGNETLLQRSIRIFSQMKLFDLITVVCNRESLQKAKNETSIIFKNLEFVMGGKTRHKSFLNGISNCHFLKEEIILIHDVARPFIEMGDIKNLINVTQEKGAASLSAPISETVIKKNNKNDIDSILDRNKLLAIKTPQAIRGDILGKALDLKTHNEPTDLCSWLFSLNIPVFFIETDAFNPKITYQKDLYFLSRMS